jgi:hypothetical protein
MVLPAMLTSTSLDQNTLQAKRTLGHKKSARQYFPVLPAIIVIISWRS